MISTIVIFEKKKFQIMCHMIDLYQDLILFTAAKKSLAQVFHHREKTKRDGA